MTWTEEPCWNLLGIFVLHLIYDKCDQKPHTFVCSLWLKAHLTMCHRLCGILLQTDGLHGIMLVQYHQMWVAGLSCIWWKTWSQLALPAIVYNLASVHFSQIICQMFVVHIAPLMCAIDKGDCVSGYTGKVSMLISCCVTKWMSLPKRSLEKHISIILRSLEDICTLMPTLT